MVNNVMISTSLEQNDTNAKTSSSRPSFSNGDNKTSISDVSFNGTDSLASRPAVVTNSVVSDKGEAPGSTIPSVSEPTLNREGEGTDGENAGLVKEYHDQREEEKKGISTKSNAAGTTSDLYMAYKGPEEKKETASSPESMASSSSINSMLVLVDTGQDDVATREKAGQNKAEPDDWEDATDISTPKLETVDGMKQIQGG
ncbi:hypothetical protein U1Q18_023000 [Sarracenia purpurea var. burkii]